MSKSLYGPDSDSGDKTWVLAGEFTRGKKSSSNVNLNTAADTQLTGLPAKWIPTGFIVTDVSTSLAAGNTVIQLRTASAGGGNNLISSLTLTNLTSSTKISQATLAAVTDYLTQSTIYARVSTPAGFSASARVIMTYDDLT